MSISHNLYLIVTFYCQLSSFVVFSHLFDPQVLAVTVTEHNGA